MPIPRPLRHALLALLLLLPAAAGAATSERALANGLRVIVHEDHRAPVVSVQVWYRVGAVNEPPGLTGLSHVLEHMMFKGTREVPAGEFARLVARFGGEHNAFTSVHYTGYYQDHDRSRLPLALALEADRMRQLVLDEGEFRKELQVVIEERRMRVDDNPMALARERFRAIALTGNPAGRPVIGWPAELAGLTLPDLRDWYDTWYAPNNAILVIAGDVATDEAYTLAERHFGALRARRLPRNPLPRSAEAPGLRELTQRVPVAVPALQLAWNVPSLSTAPDDGRDAWALAVLAGVLDGGLSARLESTLVRRLGVAAGAGAGYSPIDRGDTLFTLSATPAPGKDLDALREAIDEVIAGLRDRPPSAGELARVKAQVVSAMVFGQDSVHGQASLLGALAASGYDWRLRDAWSERIAAVTAADVQRVARRWLTDDRLTVARILPGKDKAAAGSDAR